MKLNCGLSALEKFQRREEWHRHFAWLPVRTAGRECRWLETVERKGSFFAVPGFCFWEYEYRATGDE